MRPYLTIALLLVASIGVQASDGDSRRVDSPAKLISSLVNQQARVLAGAQISLPSQAKWVVTPLADCIAAPGSVAGFADPPALVSVTTGNWRCALPQSPDYAAAVIRGP